MPRETVSPQVGPFEVQVGWYFGQNVQLGVTVEGGRSIFWQLLGTDVDQLTKLGDVVRTIACSPDDNNENLGRMLLNSLDVRLNDYNGLWSDLNRYEINRLIKLLRKARDSAYGRDE